jgi:Cd2+/Zn2+-exporting ATPase
MDTAVKREYTLQNLCCPTCAAKIEKHIQALEGVDQALIDFSSQRLTIEAKSADFWDDIMNRAERIIKDLEPSVELRNTASRPRERGAGAELDKNPPVSPRVLSRRLCLGLGGGLFAAGLIVSLPPPAGFGVFLASYLLVGGEVVLKAVKNILKGELFDENFLMSIATVGAFAIGEYPEGAAVMIFYRIGEIFEELAVNRSRKSIASLMDIRPDYANLKTADGIQRVPPETVQIGDRIVVKPGEKVPLDGIVEDGTSALDTSALTGESVPKDVEKGAAVLSGSINKNGLLTIAVTKTFGESTVSKILDLVQNAGSKKSAAENFITRFARYYTPAVVFSALALAIQNLLVKRIFMS